MPWSPGDAYNHTKKASNPRLQRQWAHVANSELEQHGDEARAIRAANSVVGRRSLKSRKKVRK